MWPAVSRTRVWRAGRRTPEPMTRASSVDQLEPEIQAEIGRLRMQGCTIDAIVAHLRTLHGVTSVSRSAMGRHVKRLDKATERIRRSRQDAEALKATFGDAPESTIARVNIEMMHSLLFGLMSGGDDELDEEALKSLAGNPQGIAFIAKSMKDLAAASKINEDFVTQLEKRVADKARSEAAKAVDAVGRERGITRETLEAIKAGIFGIKAAA